MSSTIKITDPTFTSPPAYSSLDKFFIKYLRDERDLPFVYLSMKISLIMIPLGILLFMPFISGALWWVIAVAYLVLNNAVFKGPFGLMLHCTSHRMWFKKKYNFANHYLPWVVGPFFGVSPNTYYAHHIGMHHPENNLEEDLSSTMPFQRDSVLDFMKYLGHFLAIGLIELAGYFRSKNRPKMMKKLLVGEFSFYLLCILLCLVNWPATLVVFIIPFLTSRTVSMMGNWSQHTFVDAADPGNPYKNSITCINAKYNHKCWNDGYHISHHLKPSMHWTEHPQHFLNNLDKYASNDAIVFEQLDFLKVFFYAMGKRYDLLADHMVNFEGRYKSKEEIIEFLKSRTKKIEQENQLAMAA